MNEIHLQRLKFRKISIMNKIKKAKDENHKEILTELLDEINQQIHQYSQLNK